MPDASIVKIAGGRVSTSALRQVDSRLGSHRCSKRFFIIIIIITIINNMLFDNYIVIDIYAFAYVVMMLWGAISQAEIVKLYYTVISVLYIYIVYMCIWAVRVI